MPTFNTTDPKPGFVYDSDTDTWYPLSGIAPASSIDQWVKTMAGGETSVSGAGDDSSILAYTPGTEQVYLNGVLLVRNDDYTATNGTSITGFSPALSASDVVEVITYNPSNIQITDAVLKTDIAAKGDLIVGNAVDNYGILSAAATSGYILSVNSSTATGLEWIANDQGDITAVTSGTGISVSSSTGPVPSVAVDTAVVATTNNTLTMSGKTLSQAILVSPEERMNIVASAATGTVALDALTSGSWYYTSNATGNWVLNVRGSSTTSLDSILTTGDAITVAFMATQGSTAYYQTSLQVDGTTSGVTVEWQGGTAPSAGNASSIDVYLFNIIKTASATFTVLASQTKFA
jgi:hypothetical protein